MNQAKLMESGSVRLDGATCQECQMSRGMPVISADGQPIGWVAAVVLGEEAAATEVLLARQNTTLHYYRLPPSLIAQVADGKVLLRVTARQAAGLPRRQTP